MKLDWDKHFFAEIKDGKVAGYFNATSYSIIRSHEKQHYENMITRTPFGIKENNFLHDHPDYINKAELRKRLEGLVKSFDGPSEHKDCFCVTCRTETGFNQEINQIIEEILK